MKVLAQGGPVNRLALAPGGRLLAAAGPGGLAVWDWPAGRQAWGRPGWRGVCDLAFVADGRLALAFGSSWVSQGEVCAGAALADPAGRLVCGLDAPNRVYALALPAADVFLAAGYTYPSGKTVVRGRLSTGERDAELGSFEGVLRFATLASGGRRLLLGLGARNQVAVRDLAGFRPVLFAGLRGEVTARAIAPAGGLVAVAHGRDIAWWDVDRGSQGDLAEHAGAVRGLAFSPDGRLLAGAGTDGQVVLWRTADWQAAGRYDWGVGPLAAVAFAPDGMTAVAAGERGQVVVWDVDAG